MKIDPGRTHPDLCHASIGLLRSRCEAWFARSGQDAWFPDDLNPFPPRRSSDPVNVVLFGSFLRRFLESGNWPAKEVRLWVLCQAARDTLCSLFRLPAAFVGILPREELFPIPTVPTGWPASGIPCTFVFAGRLSPSKNIEMLLRTVCELQARHGRPVRLELCGDFDDQIHPDRGRREPEDHRAHLLRVGESLPWKTAPVWHQKSAPEEWLKKDFVQPIFTSFSTFISEDFGVALAQAQTAGWPALITDWGGHRDVNHARKIDPAWIGDAHEPSAVIALKARSLADHLHRNWNKLSLSNGASATPRPDAIPLEQIDRSRREFFVRWGADSHLLDRESLQAFADTPTGRRFFSAYRMTFSALTERRGWVAVINDLNPESPEGLFETCRNLAEKAEAHSTDLRWISARDLDLADVAFCLNNAERVFVPFNLPATTAVLRPALTRLAPQAHLSFLGRDSLEAF